jgi:hypothetical protein
VVAYIFTVAVFNLALGYFVAAHLGRRCHDLTAAAGACAREPDGGETTGALRPATAEDIAQAIQSVVGDEAAGLAQNSSEQSEQVQYTTGRESPSPSADSEDAPEGQPPEHEWLPPDEDADHQSDAPVEEIEEPGEDDEEHGAGENVESARPAEPAEVDASIRNPDSVEELEDPDVDAQRKACELFIALHEAQKERRHVHEATEEPAGSESEVLEALDLDTHPVLDACQPVAGGEPMAEEANPWPMDTNPAPDIPFDTAFHEEDADIH